MKAPKNIRADIKCIVFEKCLAKTRETETGIMPGLTVAEHCVSVGIVAQSLINRINKAKADILFPPGCDFIAALHDLGKISPGFQTKLMAACGLDADLGVEKDYDKLAGFHTAIGQATMECVNPDVAKIIGRHHGSSPEILAAPDAAIYGGSSWLQERLRLYEYLGTRFKENTGLILDDVIADSISGLVTVADWIASGCDQPIVDSLQANDALDRAGFVSPSLQYGLSFASVFGFEPNNMQSLAAEGIEPGGIQIIEAPMGTGKTEAALYSAYRLLETGAATGIYFALPTRATSDRMLERFNSFLDVILDRNSSHRHALLLHGEAWLRSTSIGEEGEPGGSWYDASKRGILAPFGVGTIDQALLAVMNVRFGFVRSFGLTGKVVILDEVHSYDCYTGTLLDKLASTLVRLGASVIILSATLTKSRRMELCCPSKEKSNQSEENTTKEPYPLLTSITKDGRIRTSFPDNGSSGHRVSLRRVSDDSSAYDSVMERALAGNHVLWIENSVVEAQNTFAVLSARASGLGIACGLLHSRFISVDRMRNENEWVSCFGKEGIPGRGAGGKILVGTQVLEQSLDIDCDFLVSRLAPTDLILQRTGRLWRHRENDILRRKIGAICELWILSPSVSDLDENPKFLGRSASIYSPYILRRSLEVLSNRILISIPDEIRTLLEETYSNRIDSMPWSFMKQELEQEKVKLRRLARGTVALGGKTFPDTEASTRFSEIETRDVLILSRMRNHGDICEIETLDGQRISLPSRVPPASRRKTIAAALRTNMVAVPISQIPFTPLTLVRPLKPYAWLGEGPESLVAVGIVSPSGKIMNVDGSELSGGTAYYNRIFGYQWRKKGVSDNDSEV